MAIDVKMIKELREKTGMGITQCKKALEESNGDMEKAEMSLRKAGWDKGRQTGFNTNPGSRLQRAPDGFQAPSGRESRPARDRPDGRSAPRAAA